jgi:hypothetical protein
MKKIIFILSFFIFIPLVFADIGLLEEKVEIINKNYLNYAKELREETPQIKDAAKYIKQNLDSLDFIILDDDKRKNFIAEVKNICTTTFCGGGIKKGLDITKEELQTTELTTSDNLTKVVLGLVKFVLPYIGLIVFISLVYGGFTYIVSFGEDSGKGLDIMKNSAIGILIIYLAYAIVNFLLSVTG